MLSPLTRRPLEIRREHSTFILSPLQVAVEKAMQLELALSVSFVHRKSVGMHKTALESLIDSLQKAGVPECARYRGTSELGRVSRASSVQTAVRNCTRDEGGPFGFGDQELIPSYRKLLWSKAMVVSVAEKSGR